jgi:ribosomal protein L31E
MDKEKSPGGKLFAVSAIEKARRRAAEKGQHDTNTPPIETPAPKNYLLNTLPSEPVQISPEKRFTILLALLKLGPTAHAFYPEEDFARQAVCAGLPLLASPEQRCYFLTTLKPIAIKIMESGIFINGGLKGNILSQDPIIYDFYPIENIDQFIFGLASVLYRHEMRMSTEYPLAFQCFTFIEAERKLNLFISDVEIWHGKRAAQPLKTKLKELKALVRKTIEPIWLSLSWEKIEDNSWKPKINPAHRKPRSIEIIAREMVIRTGLNVEINETSKGPRDTTIKEIRGLFDKHIKAPFDKHIKAPEVIIGKRVSELLAVFGIERQPDTIRRKPKKKKA